MANQRAFGRRAGPQSQPQRHKEAGQLGSVSENPNSTEISVNLFPAAPTKLAGQSLEDELREWKQARKQTFKIPWRQLSLMAGLCFGIASLVLPDSIDEPIQWLVYALAAASFYAGLHRRPQRGG